MEENVYDKTADIYDVRHNTPTSHRVRTIENRFIRRYAKGRVLDIGCGTGYHLDSSLDITGLDISRQMISFSMRTGKPVLIGDGLALPFRSSSFDTVLCMFSVLNMTDHRAMISEISRVLKKNSFALVSVTSIYDKNYSYTEKKSVFPDPHTRFKGFCIDGNKSRMYLFTKEEITAAFRENGLELADFDSAFILQKPKWCSFEGFTPAEKAKLILERFLDKDLGCMYIMAFRKASQKQHP